jgi:hypothetical protein
MSREELLTLRA